MKDKSKTIRHINILGLLPPYGGRRMSTTRLVELLQNSGHNVKLRTVQRDLVELSQAYALLADDRVPTGWCWAPNANIVQIPHMDPSTALAFVMAEASLQNSLPAFVYGHLKEQFRLARNVLRNSADSAGSWLNKFQVIHRVPALGAPRVHAYVQEVIYEALYTNGCVDLEYEPRAERIHKYQEIRPVGLVIREGVAYVIGLSSNGRPRKFALHRIVQAQAIAKKNRRHSKFNLNAYLEEEGIGFGNGPKIKLKIKMDRYAAWHFRETPISTDQTWNELDGNHVIITATVRSSEELRWWLLSYENRLEVLAPNRLRKQMQESIQQMATVYSDSK